MSADHYRALFVLAALLAVPVIGSAVYDAWAICKGKPTISAAVGIFGRENPLVCVAVGGALVALVMHFWS